MAKRGIEETKDLVVGSMELVLLIVELCKDGIGMDDFMKLFMALKDDERFVEAFDGISEVPMEALDLDFQESMELGGIALNYVPKILNAIIK